MRLSLAGVLAEAGALWRRDRPVLWPLIGLFVFLPSFALLLALPEPPPSAPDATAAQAQAALFAYLSANLHWILIRTGVGWVASVTVLSLYLDPARPTVGAAMRRLAILLPRYMAAMVLMGLATFAGLFLFVVPGLFILGRTFLVGPALVARADHPVLDVARDAIDATQGQGWRLLALLALLVLAGQGGQIIAALIGALFASPALPEAIARAPAAVLAALVVSAVALVTLLAQVAVYRRLAARHGI
ncbi:MULTISPECIES: hypothetical protein [unclassified Sphingomonas]|uniref:hypothetical protein n=1 Tax=unclassified Sphingomonas TaxID=196159 RepID=UPI00082F2173|nr:MULTISPECIES: hypothetical protein [unclassified Sphingomonas]